MKSMLMFTFILVAVTCYSALANPATHSVDRIDRDVGDIKYVDMDRYNYRNSRLRRAYYYDDDGDFYRYESYEPRTRSIRRQDSDLDEEYKYSPIVRYRSQRTERKKLFVPNLWG